MIALLVALFAIVALYLPGLVILSALAPVPPTDTLERHFARVVIGALLNGWLALLLAELHIFSSLTHTLALLAICLVAGTAAWRRGVRWRSVLPTGWGPELLAYVALGLGFALLVARPYEMLLGVRDAGVYITTGLAIARTGSVTQYDPFVADIGRQIAAGGPGAAAAEQASSNLLGTQNPRRWLGTRLRAAGFFTYRQDLASGRLVPQGFHLLPAWIGLLAAFFGPKAGMLAPGLLGWLGVWGVGMVGRRLAGRRVGFLGALLLALNGVQVWFSHYATAESLTQFLIFAGLWGIIAMMGTGQQYLDDGEPDWATDAGISPLVGALIAGVALGQWGLVRIDFLIVLPFVGGYLLWQWLTRRWSRVDTWLAAGFGAMLLHTALHILFVARIYFIDTLYARLQDRSAIVAWLTLPFLSDELREVYLTVPRSALRNPFRLPAEVLALVVALLVLVWLRRDGRVLAWGERRAVRWKVPLVRAGAVAVVLLGVYAYLVRPQLLTPEILAALPGCLMPSQLAAPAGPCLTWQGYIGAPITPPPGRGVDVIPFANLVRVGWYLSPPGVALAIAGLALWFWQGFDRRSWMFFGLTMLAAFAFIRQTYGTSDQTYIYILRRYVPQTYPLFCLSIAYALVVLGRGRRWRVWLAGGVMAALVLFNIGTNLKIYRHVEYAGITEQIAAIAEPFRPDDLLLFRGNGRDTGDLLTTPLTYVHGLNATTLKSETVEAYTDSLATFIGNWQAEGRRVFLITGASGGVRFPGQAPAFVRDLVLTSVQFEELTNQKPTNQVDFRLAFRVYQLQPDTGGPAVPAVVTASETIAQLRGFYPTEQFANGTAAWTDGNALLRLALPPVGADTLTLRLGSGLRPASLPAQTVDVDMAAEPAAGATFDTTTFQPLGTLLLLPGTETYTLALNRSLLPTDATTVLVRLRSSTWVPADVDPAQRDRRSIGVLFYSATTTGK